MLSPALTIEVVYVGMSKLTEYECLVLCLFLDLLRACVRWLEKAFEGHSLASPCGLADCKDTLYTERRDGF